MTEGESAKVIGIPGIKSPGVDLYCAPRNERVINHSAQDIASGGNPKGGKVVVCVE